MLMAWRVDRTWRVVMWGIMSWFLAAILHLLGLANFFMSFWGAWILSAGAVLARSSFTVSASGKAVLITGCDSGIGHALALHLDRLGFQVFAGCLETEGAGLGVEKLRREGSARLQVVQLDVTSQDQLKAALHTVKKALPLGGAGGLWGLVNNAGVSTYGAVEWVPLSTYSRLVEVNLLGPIAVTKTFLPLVRRARGRVVNVTSVEGRLNMPLYSTYQITKHALECFTDCLRNEVKPFGVRVSIVEPGDYNAGTMLNSDDAVRRYAEEMWANMSDEVRSTYGRNYFQCVLKTKLTANWNGLADLGSVVDVLTEALTQKYPQCRYVSADLYVYLMVLVAQHLPEWFYDWLFVGSPLKP